MRSWSSSLASYDPAVLDEFSYEKRGHDLGLPEALSSSGRLDNWTHVLQLLPQHSSEMRFTSLVLIFLPYQSAAVESSPPNPLIIYSQTLNLFLRL